MSIEVLFGFDMETDIGSWTPFHEGLRHATPLILDTYHQEEITGTFYFVGHSAKEVPESVLAVKAAGHEIGAHSLYHETVGEAIFPIPAGFPLLEEEIEPRLRLNTLWIEQVCGVRPVSFRSPRLFGSSAVCRALENLQYVSDASYPLYFFRDRLEPYHPEAFDWTKPGSLNLVEIPNFADLTIDNKDPFGRDSDQWPLFRTKSASALLERVDHYLDYLDKNQVSRKVLTFYFHPWEFWEMPQGAIHYGEGAVTPDSFLVERCGEYAMSQFIELIRGLKSRGAKFKTAKEIAATTYR